MAKKIDPQLVEILNDFGDTPEARLAWAIDRYGVDVKDGCWIWRNSVDGSGYGNLSVRGKMWRAHRLFYFLAYGVDPTGMVVMHKCDVPRCVHPNHLVLGTQRDNIRDRHNKGRNGACRGDDAPWSSMTSEKVSELRRRFEDGEPRDSIAADFGISKTQMYRIVKRESWRHI